MNKYYFCLAVLGFIFLGWIVFRADTGTMPQLLVRIYDFPYGDKVGHFFLMGSLALSINMAFPACQIRLLNHSLPAGSLITSAGVLLEECTQVFFKTRTFSLADLAADALGIIIISIFIFKIIQKQSILIFK
jgi:polysaccharide biosynthesis protein VpsQ